MTYPRARAIPDLHEDGVVEVGMFFADASLCRLLRGDLTRPYAKLFSSEPLFGEW